MGRTTDLLQQLPGQIQKAKLLEITTEQEELKKRKPYASILNSLEKFKQDFQHQSTVFDFQGPQVKAGKREELSDEQYSTLLHSAEALIPWKKGPFNLYGEVIDAEWRSDLKWERVERAIGDLTGKSVLDIGCNNGYFMYRLLSKDPKLVLGIDPVVPNLVQFNFLHHLIPDPRLFFEMWGVEHLHYFQQSFDLILSMGIIYHHRNPIEQLIEKRRALRPGGEMIIETIAIPGKESYALFPQDRYAKMRNVWFVPTTTCLKNWIQRARFCDVEVLCESDLTTDEQRLTKWCPPPRQSLEDFLDPNDPQKTIEGHPAPIRVAFKARRHPDDKQ